MGMANLPHVHSSRVQIGSGGHGGVVTLELRMRDNDFVREARQNSREK